MPGAVFRHYGLAGVRVEGNALYVAVTIGINPRIKALRRFVTLGSLAIPVNAQNFAP